MITLIFYAGINRLFPLITPYFPVVFITLVGHFGKNVITVDVMCRILLLIILYYVNEVKALLLRYFRGYYTHTHEL